MRSSLCIVYNVLSRPHALDRVVVAMTSVVVFCSFCAAPRSLAQTLRLAALTAAAPLPLVAESLDAPPEVARALEPSEPAVPPGVRGMLEPCCAWLASAMPATLAFAPSSAGLTLLASLSNEPLSTTTSSAISPPQMRPRERAAE